MNMTGRITLAAVLLTIVAAMPMPAAGEESGGTVIVSMDTSRVLEAHPAFRKARENYRESLEEMQSRFEGLEGEEQALAQQQLQQEMQQLGMQMQRSALEEMKRDVRDFARENGYDYVLDQGSLIAGGRDITGELVAAFSSEKKPATVPLLP